MDDRLVILQEQIKILRDLLDIHEQEIILLSQRITELEGK